MALGLCKTSLIITILVIASTSTHYSAFSLTLFDCKIVLINTSNRTLKAACDSNGARVGSFIIPPFRNTDFLSHVLVRETTLATCSMTLGTLHGTFDVFHWNRDKNRCQNKLCIWQVNESGLSLRLHTFFKLQFEWP